MIDVDISEVVKVIGYDVTNNKKPFYLTKEVFVIIETADDTIGFTIPKGYTWDGATIKSRLAQLIIGCPHEPEFVVPSLIHDYLLDNKAIIQYNRKLSSDILEASLEDFGVAKLKIKAMVSLVDIYQKYWRKNKWKV